ncbi:MAG: TolC family protein [Pirellulaceae bacterium]
MAVCVRQSSAALGVLFSAVCWLTMSVWGQEEILTPHQVLALLPRAEILPRVHDVSENVAPVSSALSIAALEQMAMANNPTIAQALRRISALEGRHLQVGLAPNPLVGYVGESIGEAGSAGEQGAFITQRVVTGGKLGLNRAVVSHEIQQAEHELRMQSLRVANDVRSRGYEVLVAQQTVDLNRQLVRISEAAATAATDLHAAREVSRVDVLQARVEAKSAALQLNNSQNDYTAAWRRLALIVGIPSLQPVPLSDDVHASAPLVTWGDSVETLLGQSPELARARAGVEQARCALARAYAGQVPDIDLEASVRYGDDSQSTIANVVVGLPLQIFDRNQGNILTAQAELVAAQREVERVELALQNRLADAYRRYANASQQVDQYQTDILPDAKSSLELVQTGYEQGEFSYLILLTAQRTYTQFSVAYLESVRELRLSSVALEGMLLSGGLDAVVQ